MTDSLVPPSTSAPLPLKPPVASTPARSPRRIVSSNDLPRTPTKEPLDPLSALSDELSSLAALHPPTGRTPQPNGRPANGWDTFTSSGFSASPDQRLRHLAATLGRFSRSSSSESSGVLVDEHPDRPKLDLDFSGKKPLDVEDIFATFPGPHTGRSASDSHAAQPAGPSRTRSREDLLAGGGQPQGLQTPGLSAVVPPPPLPHGKRKSLNLTRPSSEHGEQGVKGAKPKRERMERASSSSSRMSLSQSLRDFASQFKRTKSVKGPGGSGVKDGRDGVKRATSTSSKAGLRSGFFTASRSQSKATNLATLAENKDSTERARQGEAGEPGTARTAVSDMPTEYTTGEFGDFVKISPPTRAPLSEDTKAEDWVYIGEGGAHMIFSCRGDLPLYRGKAFRLKKSKRAVDDEEAAERGRIWREKMLPLLIPPELLLSQESVLAEASWVKEVLANAETHRPEARRVDTVTVDEDIVPLALCEDLRSTEEDGGELVLGVEIKPKWGFLASASSIVPAEAAEIKSQHCRFCLHQHQRGRTIDEERYCPLDLYSGEDERMQKAIVGLIRQWKEADGDINNLRLFAGPTMLKPADITSELSALAFVPPLLRESKATSTLRQLQAIMEFQDITSLAAEFAAAHPGAELFDRALLPEINAEELGQCVELYEKYSTNGTSDMVSDLRHRCVMYALSAIFKDCSIFINLVIKRGPLDGVQLVEGRSRVKIIDLDLKPLANLKKWYDTDETIWRYALANPPIPPCQPIHDDLPAVVETETISDVTPKRKPRTLGAVSTNTSTRAIYAATEEGSIQTDILPTPVGERLSLNDALALSPTKARGRGDEEVLTDKQDSPSAATFGKDLLVREHDAPAKVVDGDEVSVVRSRRSFAPSPSPKPVALPIELTESKPLENVQDEQEEPLRETARNKTESFEPPTVPSLEVPYHPPSRPATPRRPSSIVFLRPEEDEVPSRSETPFEPVNPDDVSEMGYDPVSDHTFGEPVPLDMVLDEMEGRTTSPSSPFAATPMFTPPPPMTLPDPAVEPESANEHAAQEAEQPLAPNTASAAGGPALSDEVTASQHVEVPGAADDQPIPPAETENGSSHVGLVEATVAATASLPIIGGVVAGIAAPMLGAHAEEKPAAADTENSATEVAPTSDQAGSDAPEQQNAGGPLEEETVMASGLEDSVAVPGVSAVPAVPLPEPLSVELPSEGRPESDRHDAVAATEASGGESSLEALEDAPVEEARTAVDISELETPSMPSQAFLDTPSETPFETPAETPFDISSDPPLDVTAADGKISPTSSSVSRSTGESYEERVVQQMDDVSTTPYAQLEEPIAASGEDAESVPVGNAASSSLEEAVAPPAPPSEPVLMRTEPVDLSAADVEGFKPQSEAPVLGDPVDIAAPASIEEVPAAKADEAGFAAVPATASDDFTRATEVEQGDGVIDKLLTSSADEAAVLQEASGAVQNDDQQVDVGEKVAVPPVTRPLLADDILSQGSDGEFKLPKAPQDEPAIEPASPLVTRAPAPEQPAQSVSEADVAPPANTAQPHDGLVETREAAAEPSEVDVQPAEAIHRPAAEIIEREDAVEPQSGHQTDEVAAPLPELLTKPAEPQPINVASDESGPSVQSDEDGMVERQDVDAVTPPLESSPVVSPTSPQATETEAHVYHDVESQVVPEAQGTLEEHAVPKEQANTSDTHPPSSTAASLPSDLPATETEQIASTTDDKLPMDDRKQGAESPIIAHAVDLSNAEVTAKDASIGDGAGSSATLSHPDQPELDIPGALPIEESPTTEATAQDVALSEAEKHEEVATPATPTAAEARSRTPEEIPLPPTPARIIVAENGARAEEEEPKEER